MILFIISCLLVFISSYLMTSVLSRKGIEGILYLPILAFSQLVLTFEVLSLFNAIKEGWVLFANVLFLFIISFIWYKKGKPLFSIDCRSFLNRVKNSFKLDKSLAFLFVGFCIFVLSAIILCFIAPINNMDAQAYHVVRSLFWVQNGNLNHFETSDIRNLCLPINSEILYAWVLLFVKKDLFLGFFSFVGYLMSIVSIYGVMGLLGYCTRKKLWAIFILSSFSSVIVQASGTETDIIIAGLVSTSVYLFYTALKSNKLILLFMASLAYALAIGTKTPAILAIPGVGLLLLALSLYYKKKEFYKPIGYFVGFGAINFLIFASFNYILNFIQFSNFMGSESFLIVSRNYYGIKGAFASFIKHLFMFLDFTGFRWSEYLGPQILQLRGEILNFFNLSNVKDGLYSVEIGVNRTLLEPIMGAGVLGFLIYCPCLIWALVKPIFRAKSKKTWLLFGFAALFFVNLFVLSYTIAYMSFNIRFVMFFIVLSSPILIYSYLGKKNPLKYIIIAFSLFYLICVSTHLWPRPLVKIFSLLAQGNSLSAVKEAGVCREYNVGNPYFNFSCALENRIEKFCSKSDKILLFLDSADSLYEIASMEFRGYNIAFANLEDEKKIDFDNYDVVVIRSRGQFSTVVKDYERRKNEATVSGDTIITSRGNTAPCVYISNPKAPVKTDPYKVQCFISKEFLDQKNLKMLGVAGIIARESEYPLYYVFYRKTK